MPLLRLSYAALLAAVALLCLPAEHACAKPRKAAARPCIQTDQAPEYVGKDVCVSAHVYDVVELKDGTRFLDVCPLSMPDAECRFLMLSLYADHGEVGELRRYQNQNVLVRGVIRPMHGRMGIMISNARQFTGGPEKFRPNPKLLRGFFGQSDQMPVSNPNLSARGRQRSFMNNYSTVQRTTAAAK